MAAGAPEDGEASNGAGSGRDVEAERDLVWKL